MNNREKTNYLKAFAILAVCTNHFINGYVPVSLGGYANGFISLFFLLSGYGIYHSLNKENDMKLSNLFIPFYARRLMRIYPLFWTWCILHGFSNGLLGFFALDFINPESPWFVPAIMQCYILAPFIFLISKRLKAKHCFAFIFISLLFINVMLYANNFTPVRAIGYRNIFCLHIFLFYLGYLAAGVKINKTYSKYSLFLSALLLIFFIQETTPQAFLSFSGKDYIFPILLSISTFYLCLTLISSNTLLPFQKTMNFIGEHTYSIYLFHGISFTLLKKLHILQKNATGLSGIIVWLLTLPLFILIFALFETIVDEFIFGDKNIKSALSIYMDKLALISKPFQQVVRGDAVNGSR